MKLGWHREGPCCNDAQCVGALITSSIPEAFRVNGEPARHLINSWTSFAWDTYQLLVALGHQCNDKPLNTASGSNNITKMRLDVLKKKEDIFEFIFFLYTVALRGKTYQKLARKKKKEKRNRKIEITTTLQGKKNILGKLKKIELLNRILKCCILVLCFLKCCCVFYLAVFCTSGPPYFYDPVGEHLSATNLLLSVAHTDCMVIPCYHSLPPHLFERRAHLLPLCNSMNNIFIIKLLTLIYLPSN